MIGKPELKIKAVELRRQGRTYSEIRREIPVAKSTLSLWFLDIGLAEHQKQRITQKRIEGQKRGAEARRRQRINLQQRIWSESQKEVGILSDREVWMICTALYWAEGSKEKEWDTGHGVELSNSDPRMIRVFLYWLREHMHLKQDDFYFELFIHETKRRDINKVKKFWSKEIGYPISAFNRVYYKKSKLLTNRKNIGFLYNGQLRVNIARSSTLQRKIEGWVRGIDGHCRVV